MTALPDTATSVVRGGISRSAPETAVPIPGTLRVLRRVAPLCRSAARLDLQQACRMLDADTATEAFCAALLRALGQGLDHAPRLFAPECPETSFDEDWLLALLAAINRADRDSADFLIRSRVRDDTRPAVVFLAAGLAGRLHAA